MTETEVIARKANYKKSAAVVVVLMPILIICLIALSAFSFGDAEDAFGAVYGVMYLVFALAILGVFIWYCVRMFHIHAKLPDIIIVREGDELSFLGDKFKIGDIRDIQYRRDRAGRWNYYYSSGSLNIFLNDGRKLSCWGVRDVEQVHGRLIALMQNKDAMLANGDREEQNG